MTDADKTVFISYRRKVSRYLAKSIYDDLKAHGYDVFWDIKSINSGEFGTIILNQIKARAHFVVLLSSGALERTAEPDDWFRREIEEAFAHGRNIVPILDEDFTWEAQREKLPNSLRTKLPQRNALPLYLSYFEAGMMDLRERYLKQPVKHIVITPTPVAEQSEVKSRIAEADKEPVPTKEELSAEHFFSRGYGKDRNDYDGKITDYSEAIRLNPTYTLAYYNRGIARKAKGDLDGSIADYTEAIRLNPEHIRAYNNRGIARRIKGDLEGAIADYSEAIKLNPKYPVAYNSRGEAYFANQQYREALLDFEAALTFRAGYKWARAGLAIAYHALGEIDNALSLWRILIKENPNFQDADWVGNELKWAKPLIEEACRLIEKL